MQSLTVPAAGGRLAVRFLVIVLSSLLLIAVPASILGRRVEGRREFLKGYHTPDWSEAHIKNQMDYVLGGGDANRVVFFGDSSTTVGIQPLLFEERTGLRSYNLGLPGVIGLDTNLRLIELYLQNHPAPELLVYAAHPKDYSIDEPNWERIRTRFAWSYGVWSGAEPFDGDFTPIYFAREGIRIAAGELRGGREHYFPASVHAWRDMVRAQRGYFASPGVLPDSKSLEPPELARFEVSPWHWGLLDGLARLTGERGIPLLIQPTPVMLRERQEDAEPLFAWLVSFQRRHPHVTVGSGSLWIYPVSAFSEAVHMNAEGATRFTLQLSELVSELYPDLLQPVTSAPASKSR